MYQLVVEDQNRLGYSVRLLIELGMHLRAMCEQETAMEYLKDAREKCTSIESTASQVSLFRLID